MLAGSTIAGAAAGPQAAASNQAVSAADHHSADTALADTFSRVDRSTVWEQTGKLKLDFPTFHTEGIAFTDDRIFLSSVEIIEPTVRHPAPQDGYDRTAGKGVGHLFVMDKQAGHLVGNTWGSRRFAEWNLQGKELSTWDNPNNFIDYQDCQYVPNSKMLCAGVTNLPQTPAAGGTTATYELGGNRLTMKVAPDNGEEGNGTEILTYEATVN